MRGQRLFPARTRGREAVALEPLTARAPDAGLLHVPVDRRQPGEQAQRLLAFAEDIQRVTQTDEAFAQPLDLARQQLILALEPTALCHGDAARQRRPAEDEYQQRQNAADAEERLDDRL